MWNIQGRPRKIHEKFPEVLVFGLEISKGCNLHNFTQFPGVELYKVFFGFEISKGYYIHSFTKFSGMEFCFIWNFQEVQRKTKVIPRVFSKESMSSTSTLLRFFFWSSPFQSNWLELILWSTFPERSIDRMWR